MNKLIINTLKAIPLLISLPALSLDDDKLLHFGVSTSLGVVSAAYCNSLGLSTWGEFGCSLGLAVGVGAFKEVIDSKSNNNNFSTGDLIADTSGALVGMGLYRGYQVLVSPKFRKDGVELNFSFSI